MTLRRTCISSYIARIPNGRQQGPLRLGVGEFYARLVLSMLENGSRGSSAAVQSPPPVFSVLQPWLEKIKDPELACMTAQRVAAGMIRFVEPATSPRSREACARRKVVAPCVRVLFAVSYE